MLELRNIYKRFSGIPAVAGASFTARPGEVTGYLGPNGSGKSTTMKIIAGLMDPSAGEILFEGKPIGHDLIAYKQRMGYVPEEPHSSHELETVERICAHVVILHRGKIVADDSIEHLRAIMSLPTLEEIFSQLAVEQDTAAISRQIADLIHV